MNPLMSRKPWVALTVGASLCAGSQVHAESNRVRFPDLGSLVHYTTVKRGDVTEHMLTTQKALDAARSGQPIPDGTPVVLVDYRGDKVHRYFVMEKGPAWGADYEERRRTGDWQFQWYWPDKSINTKENTARCQTCHQSQRDSQYLYTFNQLRDFTPGAGRAP
jgi:Cytochrome P460